MYKIYRHCNMLPPGEVFLQGVPSWCGESAAWPVSSFVLAAFLFIAYLQLYKGRELLLETTGFRRQLCRPDI